MRLASCAATLGAVVLYHMYIRRAGNSGPSSTLLLSFFSEKELLAFSSSDLCEKAWPMPITHTNLLSISFLSLDVARKQSSPSHGFT